jgi:hypothetical protein
MEREKFESFEKMKDEKNYCNLGIFCLLKYSQLPINPCPLVDLIYHGLWESWGNSNSLS